MNILANLSRDDHEESGDFLGGGHIFDSGVYEDAKIKMAYVGKAAHSNATSITVILDINGRDYEERLWITNKEGDNFYYDKKDKTKKRSLPGFISIDDLCLVSTGKPLTEQDIEDKVIKIYDFEQKKELPTNVPVIVSLLNAPVSVAIQRRKVFKQKKNDAGVYVDTDETRELNEIQKFFHAESRRTVTEAMQGMEEAVFIDAWANKNTGKTRDMTQGSRTGNTGRPGSAPAPQSPKPTKSLFG